MENHKAVAVWLFVCCALVFALVVLGGFTRLTRSGLSIVEWQPIAGAIPPLSQEQWEEAFAKYRETPEYKEVNRDMDLAGFKRIFWIEYFHRLLGRLAGLVFLAPFAYFLLRRRLAPGLPLKLGAIFALGALQGFAGWYMVASGLVAEPRVSELRLTLHLALAFAIYGGMLWLALGLRSPQPVAGNGATRGLRRLGWAITGAVALLVVTGGLVAGIRAGYAYNTFPLMNGHLIPPEIWMIEPWWRNFYHNKATVLFNHRIIAGLLTLAVPLFWVLARRSSAPPQVKRLAHLLLAVTVLQVALGIATLLLRVPIALATAHQGGALVVFTVALALNHALRAPRTRGAGALGYQPA